MAVLFTRFPEEELNCPYNPPMTLEDQIVAAGKLGIPRDQAHLIQRNPVLSMPGIPMCAAFQQWYPEQPEHVIKFGFVCEELQLWRSTNGEDAFRDLMRNMIVKGRPTQHWVWIYHLERPERPRRSAPRRGHSPAARAA